MTLILLKDNSCCIIEEKSLLSHKNDCKNLKKIAGKTIGELHKESRILEFKSRMKNEEERFVGMLEEDLLGAMCAGV